MTWNRRDFLLRAAFGLGLGRFVPVSPLFAQAAPPAEEPRFTPPPPAEESAEIAALIDKAKAALEAHQAATTDLLSSPTYMPAHPWPRFRNLVRQFANDSRTVLVTPQEPGDPLHVTGTVSDRDGKPVAGAVLYAYQTSAKGWYSDLAPHVSGNSGDWLHARLFAYLKTDPQGRYELRTIRPAGYPRSGVPQHIHVEVTHPVGGRTLGTEIRFEDDPRMTPEQRAASLRDGYVVCKVTREANGTQRVEADLRFR